MVNLEIQSIYCLREHVRGKWNSYHRFNRSLQSAFAYHLDWQQVSNIAQEILIYLQKLHERNPQAYVTTGYGGENLLNRLPDFRKSSLLVQ
jgi:hypothetical protein